VIGPAVATKPILATEAQAIGHPPASDIRSGCPFAQSISVRDRHVDPAAAAVMSESSRPSAQRLARVTLFSIRALHDALSIWPLSFIHELYTKSPSSSVDVHGLGRELRLTIRCILGIAELSGGQLRHLRLRCPAGARDRSQLAASYRARHAASAMRLIEPPGETGRVSRPETEGP